MSALAARRRQGGSPVRRSASLCVCANVQWTRMNFDFNRPKNDVVDEEEKVRLARVEPRGGRRANALASAIVQFITWISRDAPKEHLELTVDDLRLIAVIVVSHINNQTLLAS